MEHDLVLYDKEGWPQKSCFIVTVDFGNYPEKFLRHDSWRTTTRRRFLVATHLIFFFMYLSTCLDDSLEIFLIFQISLLDIQYLENLFFIILTILDHFSVLKGC